MGNSLALTNLNF